MENHQNWGRTTFSEIYSVRNFRSLTYRMTHLACALFGPKSHYFLKNTSLLIIDLQACVFFGEF
jgi:hypothetical protein